jgi:outer membrane protein OmpA-like peptidoglycan-associated protein
MSKRESPLGLISILVATFGLSIAGIWSAYQFGFGSQTDVEYTYTADTQVTSVADESNKLEPEKKSVADESNKLEPEKKSVADESNKLEPEKNTAIPTPTPTPKKLKTADDIAQNPVQTQIKFLYDSNTITDEGVEKLNQLKNQIAQFDSQSFGIRIYSNFGESEFSKQIGRQRGEEVAGYLRHLGLKNKIVISRRIANSSANNLSSQQKRNQAMVVRLYKL